MKNQILIPILLPTEDASEICKLIKNGELHLRGGKFFAEKNGTAPNQHLYLCSTQEIKERDWYIALGTGFGHGQILKASETHTYPNDYAKSLCKRIEFTTDQKLHGKYHNLPTKYHSTTNFVDGVPAIPEKAKIIFRKTGDKIKTIQVNFLEEFCKRYNQKDNQKEIIKTAEQILSDKIGVLKMDGVKWDRVGGSITKKILSAMEEYKNQSLNQKGVDVETLDSLIKKFNSTGQSSAFSYNEFLKENIQALQSNAGGFSLEDMRKSYNAGSDAEADGFGQFDKFIQSLTKEQPKADIVIEVELDKNKWHNPEYDKGGFKPVYDFKLDSSGQPILTFK